MSKNFVKDPREVVKPGDIVRVKVLDVDHARKRIALTLRLDDEATGTAPGGGRPGGATGGGASSARQGGNRPARPRGGGGGGQEAFTGGAMADALRRAGLGKS
jgi:protein Tex